MSQQQYEEINRSNRSSSHLTGNKQISYHNEPSAYSDRGQKLSNDKHPSS